MSHTASPILVFGAKGQVAQCLAKHGEDHRPIITRGRAHVDISVPDQVQRIIDDLEPRAVINAAAYTNVDGAESDAEAAFLINEQGPRHIAEACRRAAVPLIHYSTDCVFDGQKSEAYIESDATNPVSVYGRSKLAGERAVQDIGGHYTIVRVSWIFSPYTASYVTRMLDLARARDRLGIVYEEVGRPSFGPALAKASLALADILASSPAHHGEIFHLAGPDKVSRYDFAKLIFEESAKRGGPHCPIDPITSAAFKSPAKRPQNAQLDSGKIARMHGIALPEWTAGLRETLDAILSRGASA